MGEVSDPTVALPACQEAARLLPKDAAPHYGLAILNLSELSNNPSPAALQPVLDELKIGQELEAAQPPSEEVYYFLPMLGLDSPPAEYITDWVNRLPKVPTATAGQATETRGAETTLRVTLIPQTSARYPATPAPARKPTIYPTLKPTLTLTPEPSATPQPLPTMTETEVATPTSVSLGSTTGMRLGIGVAGIILIIAVVFLVLTRKG